MVSVRRAKPLLADTHREVFVKIVRRAFSQRRKMMFKLLKEDWPERLLDEAVTQLGLSRQARGESVTLEQFVKLTEALTQ